jgi:hypothetical protein
LRKRALPPSATQKERKAKDMKTLLEKLKTTPKTTVARFILVLYGVALTSEVVAGYLI